MEDLDNRQIILLTMFVSFVVSIATGIITVAMLQEAPQTLTQTVNRVVERTIERVMQASSTQSVAPSMTTVTKEVTVYAKEEDFLVSAVEKNQPHVATIYALGPDASTSPLGIGFLVSRDGVIVVPSRIFFVDAPSRVSYSVDIDGKRYVAQYIATDSSAITSPVAFLKITDAKGSIFGPVTFGPKADLHLGQTVVVLGGEMGDAIFKTTISRLLYAKSDLAATSTPRTLTGVDVVPRIPEKNEGGLVVNIDGQAIGAVIWSADSGRYVIYPSSRIFELLGVTAPQKIQASGAAVNQANVSAS